MTREQLTPQERDALVEQVRALIRGGLDRAGIKRFLRDKHGLRHRAALAYIRKATDRNLQALNETEDEALGNAVDFWRRKISEAESLGQQEAKKIQAATTVLLEIDAAISALPKDTPADNPAELEMLLLRRSTHEKLLESSRRSRFTAEQWARDAQREVDRLKGTARPARQALEVSGNLAVDDQRRIDAMTQEQLEAELLRAGIVLHRRLTLDVPAKRIEN